MKTVLCRIVLFQSTLPRGERRRISMSGLDTHTNFNPRSHEGSDAVTLGIYTRGINISIHAPTRGATEINPFISQI